VSVELILIILSSLVIFSYLFDLLARQFKIPSAILLLISGIGLRYLTLFFHIETINFNPILPLIGTVGLILIVLEGSLELKLEKSKGPLIKKSSLSALFILLFTTTAIATFLYYLNGGDFQRCFLNAVPLGIISSAIAIPSASVLSSDKKDFIIYESSLSDIFGIILFNFMLANETINVSSFLQLGWQSILILILAGLFCLGLLYLLKRITHHLKFFLIISMLMLVYGIGKYHHLPTLVIVLAFGLFLNNLQWIKYSWFNRIFIYENFPKDLNQLTQLSGESAFIVRTFFFLIFGFSLDVQSLFHVEVLERGIAILVIIYLIRIVYQKIFIPGISWAEIFLSPRGLISILLFFGIPAEQKLQGLTDGLLFFIILATSIVMAFGLVAGREKKSSNNSQSL
jgi:Kef-type K+ transport system membrane component KefB